MQRLGSIPSSLSSRIVGHCLMKRPAQCKITHHPRLLYQKIQCIFEHHFSSVSSMQILPSHARYSSSIISCGWTIYPANIDTHIRYYVVQTIDNDDSGLISDSEFDRDTFNKYRTLDDEQFDSLRVCLYPNSSDPALKAINKANSVQEVFDIIERCGEQLTGRQASQAIVTLWDLQKVYGRYGYKCSTVSHAHIKIFLEKILSHPVFQRLIVHLENACDDLDDIAISSMLLYLDRVGLRHDTPLIQKLMMLSIQRFETFDLTALSKLSVYLRAQGIRAYFIQSKILPVMAERLKTCLTSDELYMITICLYSTKRLISEPLLNDYRQLIEKNLDEGLFEDYDPKLILKVLRLLRYPEWSAKHSLLSRRLMLCIANKVHLLSVQQVIELSDYFQNYLEPREIFHKIQQYSLSLINDSESTFGGPNMLFLSSYSSLKMRGYFEALVAEQLEEKDIVDYIEAIFKTLRGIKTSNIKLCHAFWIKSLNAIEKEIKETSKTYLGFEDIARRKIYQRYMYFNNNLGGSYRNFQLERHMSSALLESLHSQSGLLPHKIANMSAFIISYNLKGELPKVIMEKLLQCRSQFSIVDTLILSRGIQINLALKRNYTQRTLMEQITAICRMLDSCTEEHLKTASSLPDVSSITRAYLNRNGSHETFLFEKLVKAHIPFLHELNSRSIRDISMCFSKTRYLEPQILDAMSQYILDNQEYVITNTLERVLSCLYNMGYYPASGEDFFSACNNIFLREEHDMRGLSRLQMCLALNMFGHLPAKLIHNIFNISFLDQLDEEISGCYSKEIYPIRVRHLLMELNRAVCIDHPEEKIPWFHENYCEELLETVPVPNSVFNAEVHQVLSQLVGGPDVLRANVKTPYFYLLDFEFLLDECNQPVPVKEYAPVRWKSNASKNSCSSVNQSCIENRTGYRRIAVLLRKDTSYCINSRQLLGRHQMERRHLEVLGYTVIEVPDFMWYSMAHATYEDKMNYLKSIIYQ